MNELTVTVSGVPNSGKTTVALIIQAALMKAGFGVHNADAVHPGVERLQPARVQALLEKDTLIDIETVQVQKDPR